MSSFLQRAATSPSLKIKKSDIQAKLRSMEGHLEGMEPQKANPTVAPNYYKLLGRIEALKAILSDNRQQLTLL